MRASGSDDPLRRMELLYEDDALLVVSKPAGLSVHGGAGEPGPTIIELARAARGPEMVLAHRLDRSTSGVLVLAKRAAVAATLSTVWDAAEKVYLTVALGRIEHTLRMARPLEERDGRKLSAFTEVDPIAHLDRIEPVTTLARARITTGRKHQIRLHLAGEGHPILLDDRHGDFAANKRWSRAVRDAGAPRPKHTLLHCARLAFTHPETGQPLAFTASAPSIWSAILTAASSGVDASALVP